MDLIWVSVFGGVIGFSPEDIIAVEDSWNELKELCGSEISDDEYWSYFSWYFEDELDGRIATDYSAGWAEASQTGWDRYHEIRNA